MSGHHNLRQGVSENRGGFTCKEIEGGGTNFSASLQWGGGVQNFSAQPCEGKFQCSVRHQKRLANTLKNTNPPAINNDCMLNMGHKNHPSMVAGVLNSLETPLPWHETIYF